MLKHYDPGPGPSPPREHQPDGASKPHGSGLLEAARRALSAQLATNGQVSVEDETVARAMHHTNEMLHDLIEENMKLHLRVQQLEGASAKT